MVNPYENGVLTSVRICFGFSVACGSETVRDVGKCFEEKLLLVDRGTIFVLCIFSISQRLLVVFRKNCESLRFLTKSWFYSIIYLTFLIKNLIFLIHENVEFLMKHLNLIMFFFFERL